MRLHRFPSPGALPVGRGAPEHSIVAVPRGVPGAKAWPPEPCRPPPCGWRREGAAYRRGGQGRRGKIGRQTALHARRIRRMNGAARISAPPRPPQEEVMKHAPGRWVPMSPARRFIADLVHFAQKVPLCTMQRTIRLAPLAEARARVRPGPAGARFFLKAYGIVAANRPQLRWAYMPLPLAAFLRTPRKRRQRHRRAPHRRRGRRFPGARTRAAEPDRWPPLKATCVASRPPRSTASALFRRIRMTARLPRPLRRLMWWFGLNASGDRRRSPHRHVRRQRHRRPRRGRPAAAVAADHEPGLRHGRRRRHRWTCASPTTTASSTAGRWAGPWSNWTRP